MGLFDRNPNETSYVHGKKHWTDVIKNSGPGDLLIWRQPEEDFNTNSSLIVMPGEEAIFIYNGTVEQVFENGKYNLSSENYPFIGRLRNAFSGGVSTFSCVVYFVRTAESMEICWGTDSPIQVRDKVWGVRTDVRTRGSYRVKITNPVLFLEKMIGNNIPFERQEELNDFFYDQFQSKIKTIISRTLNEINGELIGLDARLEEFSETIEPSIDEILCDYGLKCVKFTVAAMDVDSAKYDVIDRSQMEAVMKMQSARGDKGVMEILGNDWGRQQSANILSDLAKNPGAGGAASAGAGIGMGMAAGNAFGTMAQQMFVPTNEATQNTDTSLSHSSEAEDQTVSKIEASSKEDLRQILKELKEYYEEGLLDEEEYKAKKKEILDRI